MQGGLPAGRRAAATWSLSLANRARWLEHLAGDRFALRDAIDGVRERRVVAIRERECSRSYRRFRHSWRVERYRIERRPGARVEGSGIDARAGLRRRDDQPQRLAVETEREPGREDGV